MEIYGFKNNITKPSFNDQTCLMYPEFDLNFLVDLERLMQVHNKSIYEKIFFKQIQFSKEMSSTWNNNGNISVIEIQILFSVYLIQRIIINYQLLYHMGQLTLIPVCIDYYGLTTA